MTRTSSIGSWRKLDLGDALRPYLPPGRRAFVIGVPSDLETAPRPNFLPPSAELPIGPLAPSTDILSVKWPTTADMVLAELDFFDASMGNPRANGRFLDPATGRPLIIASRPAFHTPLSLLGPPAFRHKSILDGLLRFRGGPSRATPESNRESGQSVPNSH